MTGLEIPAEVDRRVRADRTDYRYDLADGGMLLCSEHTAGWTAELFDHWGEPRILWSDEEDPRFQEAESVFGDILGRLAGTACQVSYEKRRVEIPMDIERKYFATSLGPMVVHTRHRRGGTEIVLELVQTGEIVELFQDLQNHSIDLDGSIELEQLPF